MGGIEGGPPPYRVGEALSWAWNKFSANAAALIVSALAYGFALAVLYGIIYVLMFALTPQGASTYASYRSDFSYSTSGSLGAGGLVVLVIGGVVASAFAAVMQSAYFVGVLDIANGQQVTIGSFFKPRRLGSVFGATLIINVLTQIGLYLWIIPGIAVSIFTMFIVVALLDRNLSLSDATGESFRIVPANFGQVLLTWLVIALVVLAGAFVCGVGLLVAGPLAALVLVCAYRRLSGGQVAPITP